MSSFTYPKLFSRYFQERLSSLLYVLTKMEPLPRALNLPPFLSSTILLWRLLVAMLLGLMAKLSALIVQLPIVRAMLYNSGLPNKFWCFAAEAAANAYRYTFHLVIKKTPYEAWYNIKPQSLELCCLRPHPHHQET
jgi:hypothetical protein